MGHILCSSILTLPALAGLRAWIQLKLVLPPLVGEEHNDLERLQRRVDEKSTLERWCQICVGVN